MKKLLLFSAFLSLTICPALKAQTIIFSEDFDGMPGPTAGGAGTYVFPNGWRLRNVDNRTPDPSVAYVNEAWERREDFGSNVADSVAFSTSWYSPAGAADDWMWTPLIGPLPSNCVLNWNAKAYDPSYPDGYEVRIMTAAQGPPTGGTGVLGNQVSNSTVIFSTAAEATSWTAHSISLSAYAGQSVYISWRNNSNDKFLLVIDDVVVQQQVFNDPQLLSYTAPSEYSQIPLQQQPSVPLTAMIRNNGLNSTPGVSLTANVYNSANSIIFTSTSAATTLASGASASFTTSAPFVPSATDRYRIEYVANGSSDDISSNNMLMDSIFITDSTYARDRGPVNGILGIGAGNGGFLGQHFVTTQNAELTSVDIFMNAPAQDMHIGAAVFPMVNGFPGTTPIYTWPNVQLTSTAPQWVHFQNSGAPIILMPDTFVVLAVEVDSTLSIGLTTQIFNNNTTWVDWPTNPLNPWGNNEDYGSQFAKTYTIRANLRSACASLAATTSSVSATCGSCTDGSATVVVTGGSPSYTYAWSPFGGTGATETGLGTGNYTVTVSDQLGCSVTATVTVGNDCSSYGTDTSSVAASCATCNDGTATVTTTNGVAPYTYAWSNGDTTMTADSLLPGMYYVTVSDASGCSKMDSVQVNFTTDIFALGTNGSAGIFPNPSSGNFTLEIKVPSATDVKIEIVNSLGQTVFTTAKQGFAGGQIPLAVNAPGIYTVKLTTKENVTAMPVMVRN
jgi:hypothetical protein